MGIAVLVLVLVQRGPDVGLDELGVEGSRDRDTPGRSVSITSSETPRCPSPPVRTAVVTKSARVPEVM